MQKRNKVAKRKTVLLLRVNKSKQSHIIRLLQMAWTMEKKKEKKINIFPTQATKFDPNISMSRWAVFWVSEKKLDSDSESRIKRIEFVDKTKQNSSPTHCSWRHISFTFVNTHLIIGSRPFSNMCTRLACSCTMCERHKQHCSIYQCSLEVSISRYLVLSVCACRAIELLLLCWISRLKNWNVICLILVISRKIRINTEEKHFESPEKKKNNVVLKLIRKWEMHWVDFNQIQFFRGLISIPNIKIWISVGIFIQLLIQYEFLLFAIQ